MIIPFDSFEHFLPAPPCCWHHIIFLFAHNPCLLGWRYMFDFLSLTICIIQNFLLHYKHLRRLLSFMLEFEIENYVVPHLWTMFHALGNWHQKWAHPFSNFKGIDSAKVDYLFYVQNMSCEIEWCNTKRSVAKVLYWFVAIMQLNMHV